MKKLILAALGTLTICGSAQAQGIVKHKGAPGSPILTGVSVPAGSNLLILSGQVPAADPAKPAGSPDAFGDTKTQAISTFRKIDTLLKAQGYGLGDVVKLTVFLVGDPKLGGKLDFKGFGEAYGQFFGTAEQPQLSARSVVQVVALANPAFLVEIEATAAKAR
ncbi:MAG TPA: RidA family protein [Sphingobium sp.]